MEQERNRLRIKFVKHPAFRDVYVTGAHGGVSPGGDIYFVLHTDRRPLPEAEEVITDDAGHPVEVRQVYAGDEQVVRELLVGISLTPDTALSLAQWLIGRAEEARRTGPTFPAAH
ncbi:MAG TPA: hypothetical protein VGK74_17410 [Symbiobacteriaceae bacterium]